MGLLIAVLPMPGAPSRKMRRRFVFPFSENVPIAPLLIFFLDCVDNPTGAYHYDNHNQKPGKAHDGAIAQKGQKAEHRTRIP